MYDVPDYKLDPPETVHNNDCNCPDCHDLYHDLHHWVGLPDCDYCCDVRDEWVKDWENQEDPTRCTNEECYYCLIKGK